MGPSFNSQLDLHGAWRREFALRLKQLAEWMGGHQLMDDAVQELLQRLEAPLLTAAERRLLLAGHPAGEGLRAA